MGNNEKKIFWLCVIITMALALTAVALALPRTISSGTFDYQGVYIAIFAALVTLLIGWQIYNSIGLNRQLDKANNKVAEATKRLEKLDRKQKRLMNLNHGLYFVNCGAMSYMQGRIKNGNRLKDNITSYILTLRGLQHVMKSELKADEIAYTYRFCLEFLDILLTFIEQEIVKDKVAVKAVFNPERIANADNEYRKIMSKISVLNHEAQVKIISYQHRHNQLKTQLST